SAAARYRGPAWTQSPRRCVSPANTQPRTKMNRPDWRFWGMVVLGVGMALGGAFAGWGFAQGRAAERFVTVKGVSEREVRADLAVWPLQVVAADNDLASATAQLARGIAVVRDFMARQGLDTTQVALTA